MAGTLNTRNPRAPCKEAVDVEEVRLHLKLYVLGGIQNVNYDDTESFIEDHKMFLKHLLCATERLNPKTVEKASKRQFEGSALDHKRFGEMMASSFSYLKAKEKKSSSLRYQSPVVKELVGVMRAAGTTLQKLPQKQLDECSTAAKGAAKKAEGRLELPLRSRSRSPRCTSKASGSHQAEPPVEESAIRALYAPLEPFSPVRKPELLAVESSQEVSVSPLVEAPSPAAPEATVASTGTCVDQQCEMKDRAIHPSSWIL